MFRSEMNIIAGLLVLIAASAAQPLLRPARSYDPSEEDPLRTKVLVWEDEDGGFQFEDLTKPVVAPRAGAEDIVIYLYTRNNPDVPEVILPTNFTTMTASEHYNTQKRNVFIIHGWNNHHGSKVNTLLRSALLYATDVNIFIVDWKRKAIGGYIRASYAVAGVGEALGNFINEMLYHYNLSGKSFSLMGHSLGAHVAGHAGSMANDKINYIIGMDPAGPLFSLENRDARLDESDADFVQVIHTTGNKLSFISSLGHADYFPNGGSKQAGCGLDLFGTCGHARSYMYVAESIRKSRFVAHLCDSFNKYDRGLCTSNKQSYLGEINIDKRAAGDYFLKTNNEAPFALN